MPRQEATPIKTGPGSVSPNFTAPQIGVNTAAPQQRADPTRFERLRDAVTGVGAGIATALQGQARIDSRLKSLKEESVRRVEQDLNRAARQLQNRRLETAEQSRNQLLAESDKHGPEWLERKARSAMLNASSAEESRLYQPVWQMARQQIQREQKETEQQAFNLAARTTRTVAGDFSQRIAEDGVLRAELIGDGVGIAERVQNFLISESEAASPDAFLTEGRTGTKTQQQNRDFLIHSLVQESFGIADALRRDYDSQVTRSNVILGTQQIEADVSSTLSGEQDPKRLSRQLEITLDERFGHAPDALKMDAARSIIRNQLQALAEGAFGLDAVSGIDSAKAVLTTQFKGQNLFTQQEANELSVRLLNTVRKTSRTAMEGEIAQIISSLDESMTLPDGTAVQRPNPNALAIMAQVDPITGTSLLDDTASGLLARMGLLKSDLSSEEALIVGDVRAIAAGLGADAQKLSVNRQVALINHNLVLTGGANGDANDAYQFSMIRRTRVTPAAAALDDSLIPLAADEVQALKAELLSIADTDPSLNLDRESILAWDGQPLEFTPENADINKALAISEAALWSDQSVQDQYGVPSELLSDKLTLLRSRNPEARLAALDFFDNLGGGRVGAFEDVMASSSLSSQEKAALVYSRTISRLGPSLGEEKLSDEIRISQIDRILEAPPVNQWLGRAGDLQEGVPNVTALSLAMVDVFAREGDFDPELGLRSVFSANDNVTAAMQKAFVSESNSAARFVKQLAFAHKAIQSDATIEETAAHVYSFLHKEGYRWRQVNGNMRLVVDPFNYTGNDGDDVGDTVNTMWQRPFVPEYRDFIQRAMGLKPFEVPESLADVFKKDNANLFPGITDQPLPSFLFNERVQDRLLVSRADLGGFVLSATSPGGIDLPPVVTKSDAVLNWPDGTSSLIPAGTPIAILNPDLYTRPTRQDVSRGTGFVRTVPPPQVNIPKP